MSTTTRAASLLLAAAAATLGIGIAAASPASAIPGGPPIQPDDVFTPRDAHDSTVQRFLLRPDGQVPPNPIRAFGDFAEVRFPNGVGTPRLNAPGLGDSGLGDTGLGDTGGS